MHSVMLAEIAHATSTLFPIGLAVGFAEPGSVGWYVALVAGLVLVAGLIGLVVFKLLGGAFGPGQPALEESEKPDEDESRDTDEGEPGTAPRRRVQGVGSRPGRAGKSRHRQNAALNKKAGKEAGRDQRPGTGKDAAAEKKDAKSKGATSPTTGRRGEERPAGVADRPEPVSPIAAAPIAKPAAPVQRELRDGLSKTRAGFIARIGELLRRKEIDQDLFVQLEEVLLTADIGVKTAQHLFEQVRASLNRKQLHDPQAVWAVIKEESQKLLTVDSPPIGWASHKPFVILVIGVNGAGKTTTIGKLAAQQVAEGRKVVLAAGDTFRAAAVEQLEVWGQRAKVPVVRGKEGGDPSAVIFDAIKRAQQEQADVVIADTAGRLHVKEQLMAELQKIRRVMKKADPTAPHETWLVLDATNGQNALAQASTFKEMMEVTGIILTKLDGTAKGGVILGIAHELGVPVRYIGVGEKISDLRAFDAEDFVDVLYDRAVN
jgi:fused signal recognition particle receptor